MKLSTNFWNDMIRKKNEISTRRMLRNKPITTDNPWYWIRINMASDWEMARKVDDGDNTHFLTQTTTEIYSMNEIHEYQQVNKPK